MRQHSLRWWKFLPLLACVLALALPTLAEARAGGGRAPSGGGVNRPSNARIGVRPATGGSVMPVTPAPAPTVALATIQPPTTSNGVIPVTAGVASVANQESDTPSSPDTNVTARPAAAVAPAVVVLTIILVLIAGSAIGVAALFALCAAVQRHDRRTARAAR